MQQNLFFFTIPIIKSNSKVLASAQPVSAVPIDTIPPRLDKNTRPCLLHNLIYIYMLELDHMENSK
jgi:hypothetical protein